MPVLSKTFEFYNPWSTKNTHTTQPSITMPQMVNGRMPDPSLTLFSDRIQGAGFYGLGARTHSVAYCIEGSFIGTCTMQVSTTPNPSELDWQDLPDTKKHYIGLETTGGAGISGGFSGAVSKPIQTDLREFTGDYAWVRVRLDICRGTLQAVKLNY
jgi:hypothetical protein